MRARQTANALEYSRRDMLTDCENGDAHACQYLVDHPEAFEPEPERTSWATVIIGGAVVWALAMAWLGVGL